jgi:hypothetical protein
MPVLRTRRGYRGLPTAANPRVSDLAAESGS